MSRDEKTLSSFNKVQVERVGWLCFGWESHKIMLNISGMLIHY